MLSHDLRNMANAMRLSADAPAADLRHALISFADATECAANRASALQQLTTPQIAQGLKARLRRCWTFISTLAVEAAR
jgi:hypothetical protein